MANIELRVRGQRLLMNRGYVVAGTVLYLTIKAALSEDWRGREVWAYLEYGDKKYRTRLNANGESTARAGLNLSAGEWSIYLMGYGVGRFIIEGLRTDQLVIKALGGIAASQVLSIILIVLAVAFVIYNRVQLKKRTPVTKDGNEQ